MSESNARNSPRVPNDSATPPNQLQKKQPYKVVFESVTQEKKKLKSSISSSDIAPAGYTYVATGWSELTEFCKEESRQRGLEIFIVSRHEQKGPRKPVSEISQHTNRIGYHFPNSVVDKALNRLKQSKPTNTSLTRKPEDYVTPATLKQKLDSHGQRLGINQDNVQPQQVYQQIEKTIQELFPKIPKEDCEAIVDRAFGQDPKTVGNATDLSLPNKVQLAVVAYIRHNYTDYDALLNRRIFRREDARKAIEDQCLDIIVKWRGEDETNTGELEDILRETIIIDEDDEDVDVQEEGNKSGFEVSRTRQKPSNLTHEETSQAFRRTEEERMPRSSSTKTRDAPRLVHVQPHRGGQRAAVLSMQDMHRRYFEARTRMGYENKPSSINPPSGIQLQEPSRSRNDAILEPPSGAGSSYTLPLRIDGHARREDRSTQGGTRTTKQDNLPHRLNNKDGEARPFYVSHLESRAAQESEHSRLAAGPGVTPLHLPARELVYRSVENPTSPMTDRSSTSNLQGVKRKAPVAASPDEEAFDRVLQISGVSKRPKPNDTHGQHMNPAEHRSNILRRGGRGQAGESFNSGHSVHMRPPPEVINLLSSPERPTRAPRAVRAATFQAGNAKQTHHSQRMWPPTSPPGQQGLWPRGIGRDEGGIGGERNGTQQVNPFAYRTDEAGGLWQPSKYGQGESQDRLAADYPRGAHPARYPLRSARIAPASGVATQGHEFDAAERNLTRPTHIPRPAPGPGPPSGWYRT